MNKERICSIIDNKLKNNFDEFVCISDYIFRHPELGGEEFLSAEYLCTYLKEKKFEISYPCPNIPTAFIAEYGPNKKNDKTKVVAFVAEYDALPGFGPNGEPGHACGHNWIAACMCGCAVSLMDVLEEINCIVKVIGTPAEETFGAKYDIIKTGAFADVDLAFQAHLDEFTSIETLSLAMNSIEFSFHGVPAHAAQNPEKGINALDAVISMFNNINAMREHIHKDERIHGIITEGGVAANIVPEFAQCKFSIRSKSKEGLKKLRERVINIAKAAELATGAKLEYKDYENPYDDMINVPALVKVCQDHLCKFGYTKFIPENEYPGSGSGDIGNVSYECPTAYVEIAPNKCDVIEVHERSAMDLVNSEPAMDTMKSVISAYTRAVVDICLDKELFNKINIEHKEVIKNRG
ncbi:MAG: M20 family metallopeptidase [Anaerovoracaceae bacterium]